MSPASVIRVSRLAGGTRDLLRAYRLAVDGVAVAKIRRGETVDVPVAPGEHEVVIRIDWTGSEPLAVRVADGETKHLVCEPAGKATHALGDLLLRRPWVILRER